MIDDPWLVLGQPREAKIEDVRAAYLRLVRENPPDQFPDRFHAIHRAWRMISEPVEWAKMLLEDCTAAVDPGQLVERAAGVPPLLPVGLLLGLGNDAGTANDG